MDKNSATSCSLPITASWASAASIKSGAAEARILKAPVILRRNPDPHLELCHPVSNSSIKTTAETRCVRVTLTRPTGNVPQKFLPATVCSNIQMPAPAYYFQNLHPVPSTSLSETTFDHYQQRVMIRPMDRCGNIVYRYMPTIRPAGATVQTNTANLQCLANTASAQQVGILNPSQKNSHHCKQPNETQLPDDGSKEETTESLKALIIRQRKLISQLVKIIVKDKIENAAVARDDSNGGSKATTNNGRTLPKMGSVAVVNKATFYEDLSSCENGPETSTFGLCKNERQECTMELYRSCWKEAESKSKFFQDKEDNRSGKNRNLIERQLTEKETRELLPTVTPIEANVHHKQLSLQSELLREDLTSDATPEVKTNKTGKYTKVAPTTREYSADRANLESEAVNKTPTKVPKVERDQNKLNLNGSQRKTKNSKSHFDNDIVLIVDDETTAEKSQKKFSTTPVVKTKPRRPYATRSTGKGKGKKETEDSSYTPGKYNEVADTKCRRSPRKRPKRTVPTDYVRRSASKQATEKISNLLKDSDSEFSPSSEASDNEDDHERKKRNARRSLLPHDSETLVNGEEQGKDVSKTKVKEEYIPSAELAEANTEAASNQNISTSTCSAENSRENPIEWTIPRSVSSTMSFPSLLDPTAPIPAACEKSSCERVFSTKFSGVRMTPSIFHSPYDEGQCEALDLTVPKATTAAPPSPLLSPEVSRQHNTPAHVAKRPPLMATCSHDHESLSGVKSPSGVKYTEEDPEKVTNRASRVASEDREPANLSQRPVLSQVDFTASPTISSEQTLKSWLSRKKRFSTSMFSVARGHGIGFLPRTRGEAGAGSTMDALRKVSKAKYIWKRMADGGKLDSCVAPGRRCHRNRLYRDRVVLTLADAPDTIVSSSEDYETPEEIAASKKTKRLKKRRDFKNSRLMRKSSNSKPKKNCDEFPFVVTTGETTESSEIDVVSETLPTLLKWNNSAGDLTSLKPTGRLKQSFPSVNEKAHYQVVKSETDDSSTFADFESIGKAISSMQLRCKRLERNDLVSGATVFQSSDELSDRGALDNASANSGVLGTSVKQELDFEVQPPFPKTQSHVSGIKMEKTDDDFETISALLQNVTPRCVVSISPLKYPNLGSKLNPDVRSRTECKFPIRKLFYKNNGSYSVRDTTDEETKSDSSTISTSLANLQDKYREIGIDSSDTSSKSPEANIAEWTMVPRRACSMAKQKISRMAQPTMGKKPKKATKSKPTTKIQYTA